MTAWIKRIFNTADAVKPVFESRKAAYDTVQRIHRANGGINDKLKSAVDRVARLDRANEVA